ncbi:MAG: hypothetical protein WD397_08950, partial [Wenzhouxiangellaceae bacterium]
MNTVCIAADWRTTHAHTNAKGQLYRSDRNALGQKIGETAADGGVTAHTEFHYDAGRSRTLKRELSGATVTSRTHYLGGVEVVWNGSNPARSGCPNFTATWIRARG